MSTKAERGIKRTCQNPECGSRFYDLNRDPIVCPICQTAFQLATPAEAQGAVATGQEAGARSAARRAGFPVGTADKPAPAAPAAEEDEEALPAIEGEEEAEVAEDDETFLEPEEEDGSDMENIIGPVSEPDEPDR
jgi:uncharacterized protein (TIGR02300 family)